MPEAEIPDPAEAFEIEPAVVATLLDGTAGERAIRLIDCREEDEFQFCRLPSAELLPLGELGEKHQVRLGPPDPDLPLVVY